MLTLRVKKKLSEFDLNVDISCPYPVTAIYGPSGSGKTTLLNLVSGLMRPDEGEICVGDTVLFSSEQQIDLPPEQRRVGYVFQDDLLFPHLTVRQNLLYGHDLLREEDRRFKLDDVVSLLGLETMLNRYPALLSGGERQRVALGRAILASPRLLVMDEPLASLDQGLKNRIIPYLRHIRTAFEVPILYVSHSVAEVLQLTGQMVVIQRGELLAHGDFFEVAHQPNVLPLIEAHGFENVLPVEVIDETHVRYGEQVLRVPFCDRRVGTQVFVGIRANDIILCHERPTGLSIRNAIQGRVLDVVSVSGRELVYVDVGKRLAVEVTPEAVTELGLTTGQAVTCLIKTHSIQMGPDVDM